jgi:hypothetical protein
MYCKAATVYWSEYEPRAINEALILKKPGAGHFANLWWNEVHLDCSGVKQPTVIIQAEGF